MEILVACLIVGFIVFWLVRHPIKSLKLILSILGLLIIGALTIFGTLALI